MTLKRNVTLPKNLRMLLPRAEAQKLLEGVILEGKALHRKRTPKKLNSSAPKAVEVTKQIKTWVTKSNKVMTQCFGEQGAGAIRKILLRYSSLDAAKERIRLRIDLLTQALERTKTLRKTSAPKHPKPQQSRRKTTREKPKPDGTQHKYDFCLSFAGEDRSYAEKLKALLEERGAQVFYDSDYQHELWGEDLFTHLDEIYRNQARFCIMFISAHYKEKVWTNHERVSAQARSLSQGNYILPVRIDDTNIPGLRTTRGHLDVRQKSLEEIADAAMRKLRGSAYKPAPSKTTKTKAKAPKKAAARGRRSSTLFMLGDHFYRVKSYREASNKLTVTVAPRDAHEELRLRQVDTRNPFTGAGLPFAYNYQSGRVRVQGSEYRSEQGKNSVVLEMQLDPPNQRHQWHRDKSQVEQLVKWLVFGDAPPQQDRYTVNLGGSVEQTDLDNGAVRKLWASWTGNKTEFREAAKLYLVFLLKDTGILDHVTLLEIGPWQKQSLSMRLKGTKQEPYQARKITVDISGTLTLETKP